MLSKSYGLFKTTLIDYPGKVASTIFTEGCNLRCPYCHNPEFVFSKNKKDFLFTWDEIVSFLKKRANLIGGVCITGGEPLLHSDLPEKIAQIHDVGLLVKIDTNGTLPERLRNLQVDYIAMDIKTSLKNYTKLGYTGNNKKLVENIKESIKIIKNAKIPHHFRTTVVPGFVDEKTIEEIIKIINGEKKYVLQTFRSHKTLDPLFSKTVPYTSEEINNMKKLFIAAGIACEVK